MNKIKRRGAISKMILVGRGRNSLGERSMREKGDRHAILSTIKD